MFVRSKTVRSILKLVALVFSLGVALCVAEWSYRRIVTNSYDKKIRAFQDSKYKLVVDAPRVFELKPSIMGEMPFGDAPHKRMSFRTNSLGLRGPEIPPKNKRLRILVLGDSYTFGWVLPEDETYPALLQSQLNSEGSDVEVINGGVPGYSTVQEEDFLKKIYPKVEPDYVVLGFVMNDAEPQHTVPQNPKQLYRCASSWMLEGLKFFWIQKHFRGSRFLSSRLYNYNGKYLKGFERDSTKWKEARKALEGIKQLCAFRHSGFLVVILPDVTENLDDTYKFAPIHKAVMNWAKDLKIDATDVLPAFRGKNIADYSVPDDGHPNKKANEIIASQIALHLRPLLKP